MGIHPWFLLLPVFVGLGIPSSYASDSIAIPCSDNSANACKVGWRSCDKVLNGDGKLPGILPRLNCRMSAIMDAYYEGIALDWQKIKAEDIQQNPDGSCKLVTARGFYSQTPVCSIVPTEASGCQAEVTNPKNPRALQKYASCGAFAHTTIETSFTTYYFMGYNTGKVDDGNLDKAVFDNTTQGRGQREESWWRGARVHAFAVMRKQVYDEIKNTKKLTLASWPTDQNSVPYCKAQFDDLKLKMNRLGAYGSALCNQKGIWDIENCVEQEEREEHFAKGAKDEKNPSAVMNRQAACHLAQARAMLEMAFHELVFCEAYWRADAFYKKNFRDKSALDGIRERIKNEVRIPCEQLSYDAVDQANNGCTPSCDWCDLDDWCIFSCSTGCSKSKVQHQYKLGSQEQTDMANTCYQQKMEELVRTIVKEKFQGLSSSCGLTSSAELAVPFFFGSLAAAGTGRGRRRRRERGTGASLLDLVAATALLGALAIAVACASGSSAPGGGGGPGSPNGPPISCVDAGDPDGSGRCEGLPGASAATVAKCCDPNPPTAAGGGYDPSTSDWNSANNRCYPQYKIKDSPPCAEECGVPAASCNRGPQPQPEGVTEPAAAAAASLDIAEKLADIDMSIAQPALAAAKATGTVGGSKEAAKIGASDPRSLAAGRGGGAQDGKDKEDSSKNRKDMSETDLTGGSGTPMSIGSGSGGGGGETSGGGEKLSADDQGATYGAGKGGAGGAGVGINVDGATLATASGGSGADGPGDADGEDGLADGEGHGDGGGSEDPKDYFGRTKAGDSIFAIVTRRYQHKEKRGFFAETSARVQRAKGR